MKELQKANQTEFKIEKIVEKKGDNFYGKCKGYDNLFNFWIDKKRYCYMKSVIFESHIPTVKTKQKLN